jgi:hypothetical protein
MKEKQELSTHEKQLLNQRGELSARLCDKALLIL